jgi:diadenosine tetraphosphatase ApaH/serine/threonine PP2A family protein phosphatase
VKGKWSAGIEPRSFTWVLRGALAISERPGGNTAVHRKVRRDEELLWLKHQGFARVISILPALATLDGYAERGLSASHYPLRGGLQQPDILRACYEDLDRSLANNTTVLLCGDDVSDRLLGVLAGYLVWSRKAPGAPTAIALVERLFRRTLGPDGRAMLSDVPSRDA